MSFIGTLVATCLSPAELPPRLTSLDDVASLRFDEETTAYTFSRNGWLNNCLEELASLGHVQPLPTGQSPAVVLQSGELHRFIAGMKTYLDRVSREPRLLPAIALELANDADLERCRGLSPASLRAALDASADAKSRDEEAEGVETLVCQLWCQLRLAEHAAANGLAYICVRSR